MDPAYKTVQHPNSVLVFVCDVLAVAGGAGVMLTFFHWLADVLPIVDRLGVLATWAIRP
jgi:hypothetical protein